jgi:SAM-dependent methyltransferase
MSSLRSTARPPTSEQMRLWLLRVRSRMLRGRIESLYREVAATLDWEALRAVRDRLIDTAPQAGPGKFLNYEKWLREACRRFLVYDFDRLAPGSRVLDLGCGGGFFLVVCRHAGFATVGLDLDEDPVFNSLIAVFGLERIACAIEPGRKLPDLGGPFDAVAAFMTCFNKLPDGSPWNREPWQFLLEDLRTHVVDGGRVVIKFNVSSQTGEYYPREVGAMMRSLPGYSASFYRDSVVLRAR